MAGLGDLVDDLAQRWSLQLGEPLGGGTTALVLRVSTAEGESAVLKVSVPDPGFLRQVEMLRAAAGHGYVKVLADDVDRYAVLLEGQGPDLRRSSLTPHEQLDVLGKVIVQAQSVPAPAAVRELGPVNKGAQLEQLIMKLWAERLASGAVPVPGFDRAVEVALTAARRRAAAFDPDRCVVVHGDSAAGNLLRAIHPRPGAEHGWVFVDPEGSLADPAYDHGVACRDWCDEIVASADPVGELDSYCRLLSATSGIAVEEIVDFATIERVSTGLYVGDLGAEDLAEPFFQSAARLAHGVAGNPA